LIFFFTPNRVLSIERWQTNTPGQVILLGTPAEETIGGKIQLLKKGAYRSMDVSLRLILPRMIPDELMYSHRASLGLLDAPSRPLWRNATDARNQSS
jgi:hypothetical protein